MMDKPILIVGGTGTVGSELITLLLDKGIRPRVLLRPYRQLPEGIEDRVEVVRGDLADSESLSTALADVENVFLLSRDQPEQAELEENLVQVAEKMSVRRIIKSSAFAAGLQPPVGYGISHARVEQRLINSSLNWVIIRPYVFMQNFLEIADVISNRGIIPLPFGQANVAFIDARDVALTAQTLLLDDSSTSLIYELTGPESLSLAQCADIASGILAKPLSYRSPPFWLAGLMMRLQGVSSWDVKMRKQLFSMVKNGGEEKTTTDFESVCGRKPRSFSNFIREHEKQFHVG